MPDSYKKLIKSNPDETEIRSFLVDGDQVSVTLRIFPTPCATRRRRRRPCGA